ncbi:hypothetical protein [Streptomyces sp. SID3343]|uniref:hypothetical protein n=1 Tax=Streptomyces sp. SID3343 TaxID=2690260 RepID=UPI00136E2FDC|nr:hypothetical protein [Streptomyces sp. SID3343]MYV98360.1 hypothetical protein [Streptomyces sp. SID3343]
MQIGTNVKAVKDIGGGLTQSVPAGAKGTVVGRRFDGRLDVAFTLAGLLGGTRSVTATVAAADVATL